MEIRFTDYAIMRMRMRDILAEEVIETLNQPKSKHSAGKVSPRKEARHGFGEKTLLVVYKYEQGATVVINAMWE